MMMEIEIFERKNSEKLGKTRKSHLTDVKQTLNQSTKLLYHYYNAIMPFL